MQCELNLCSSHSFGDPTEQVDRDLALGLASFDIVYVFTSYHKHALLIPSKHVDLLQLHRKKQRLFKNNCKDILPPASKFARILGCYLMPQ